MRVKRLALPPVRLGGGFCAIVLAAGAGRRFGGGKLTAPWGGGVLLDGALEAAFAAPVERVVVVTGADPAVGDAAKRFADGTGRRERLQVRPALNWEAGLAASLRAGLEAAGDARGAFVFLGDMPRAPRELAGRLLQAFEAEGADAAQPVFEGRPAHPVLLGRQLFEAASALEGDRGAQRLLQAPGVRVARVEVDTPGAVADVDTPDALARLAATGG